MARALHADASGEMRHARPNRCARRPRVSDGRHRARRSRASAGDRVFRVVNPPRFEAAARRTFDQDEQAPRVAGRHARAASSSVEPVSVEAAAHRGSHGLGRGARGRARPHQGGHGRGDHRARRPDRCRRPSSARSWDIELQPGVGMGFSVLHRTRRDALEALEGAMLEPWATRARARAPHRVPALIRQRPGAADACAGRSSHASWTQACVGRLPRGRCRRGPPRHRIRRRCCRSCLMSVLRSSCLASSRARVRLGDGARCAGRACRGPNPWAARRHVPRKVHGSRRTGVSTSPIHGAPTHSRAWVPRVVWLSPELRLDQMAEVIDRGHRWPAAWRSTAARNSWSRSTACSAQGAVQPRMRDL